MTRWIGWLLAGVAFGIVGTLAAVEWTAMPGRDRGQQTLDSAEEVLGTRADEGRSVESESAWQAAVSLQKVPPTRTADGRVVVKEGSAIQAAVALAQPGDVIEVHPGIYRETVYIDKDDITLRGVIVGGERPTLEGGRRLNDAILYSGNGVVVENFKISHYKGNGVMGQAGNNFVIRNNVVIDTGVYGIFPQYGTNGLIEHNVLTGIEDAAIYVGMCDNVDVRHNEVYGNVAGIEIENSRHSLVENNYAHDNTGGILVFVTPGLPIKNTRDVIVRNNFVLNNNTENFGAEGSIVAGIPAGTGILIMAADDVIVEGNIIAGNDNIGITITDLAFAANVPTDPESEPNPDRVVLLDNVMLNNGNNPVGELKALLLTMLETQGPDIAAVGGGVGSCVHDRAQYRTMGIEGYVDCAATAATSAVTSYRLSEPVAPRQIDAEEKGKLAFYGICSGCHAMDIRLIGPAIKEIQSLYSDGPERLAAYIKKPMKKRPDYPEMPPQDYLPADVRQAVAAYMLTVAD